MSEEDRLSISEKFRLREFSRMRDEARFWRQQFYEANVQLATLKAEAKLAEFRDRTDVAWLQGKVIRQARELKRLNDVFNASRVMEDLDPKPDVEVASITKIEVDSQQREADEG